VLRVELRNGDKSIYGTATVFYDFSADLAEF
jgi:hypothetical protein